MVSHSDYFEHMQAALHRAGVCQPAMIVDLDRVDANLDVLLNDLPTGMALRIVTKSLPSSKLIEHVRARADTDRLMTFNLPMLLRLADDMPDADQLLGKPQPAAAVRRFLQATSPQSAVRVQWLVDTDKRLAEYESLSREQGITLRIALELDVGLHRGGFKPDEQLGSALQRLANCEQLRFSGFMGYDAHLPSLPDLFGWRQRAQQASATAYREAVRIAQQVFDARMPQNITRNAAGSRTYPFYTDTAIASEVSAGSVFVKPSDFDCPILARHKPACFIAAPVLKAVGKKQRPGIEWLDHALAAVINGRAQSFFIHGGYWLAHPVSPPGLSYDRIYGRSSNQEMLNGPRNLELLPDDFIFLRPSQSEAVFLQFGDLAVYRGGEIIDWWPTLPVSA